MVKSQNALEKLQEADEIAGTKPEGKESAEYFKDVVVPSMAALRMPIDELELIVDKELWPVPTYGDLLFEV